MIRKILVLALLVGCGGVDNGDLFPEEPEGDAGIGQAEEEPGLMFVERPQDFAAPDGDIGVSEEALTRPGLYGAESTGTGGGDPGGGGYFCSVPWNWSLCFVKQSKSIRLKFFASTCSSWWQTRVVEAQNALNAAYNGIGWYWAGPSFDGSYEISVKCAAGNDGALGGVLITGGYTDTTVADGTIRKWNKGNMEISPANVEAQSGWASYSEAQKQRYARNLIKHEFGHTAGLGHNTSASALMYPFAQSDYPNADKLYQSQEAGWLQNYVP
jgi:hypothetical protein